MGSIKVGEFKPGDRLREIDMANRFNLASPPVREALRRPAAEMAAKQSTQAEAAAFAEINIDLAGIIFRIKKNDGYKKK